MSTPGGGSTSEFRQRAGGNVQHAAQTSQQQQQSGSMRRSSANSSSSSLPRPGASPGPRSSPTGSSGPARRTYSSTSIPSMPPPYGTPHQRSGSATSLGGSASYASARSASYTSVGSTSGYTAAAAAAASQLGGNTGSSYGGYGMNSSSSTSNGYGNSSASSRRDSDNKYNKPKRGGRRSLASSLSSTETTTRMMMVIGVILLFVYSIIMTTMYFSNRGKLNTVLTRLDLPDTLSVVNKVEDLERQVKTTATTKQRSEQNALKKSNNRINQLERELKLVAEEKKQVKEIHLPEAQQQVDKLSSRESAFAQQIGWLMDVTRRESKRMVLERFGAGPHKVEFTFKVPTVADKTADAAVTEDSLEKYKVFSFVVELAPLDLVPHAIHLFLEQIDHGLMDGTHFYLNGPHIVQAGPQPKWDKYYDGSDDTFQTYRGSADRKVDVASNAVGTIKKYEETLKEYSMDADDDEYLSTQEDYHKEEARTKDYVDAGLEQLAFPDYSEQYPHVPWTIGFTGRPGGPDWYINKVDNTKGHGPGGQYQYELSEQGDSCFGIISAEGGGRTALAKYLYPGEIYADHSEWHHFLDTPVEISHAHILTKNPILDHHLHMDHLNGHKVFHNVPRKTEHGQEARKRRLAHEAKLAADEEHKRWEEQKKQDEYLQSKNQIRQQNANNNKQRIQEQPNRGRVPNIDGAQEA